MTTNADLLLEATNAPSISAISKRIGVPKPTFNTQVQNGRIPTDTLVKITRVYDIDILSLMAKLEIITVFEAKKARTSTSLSDFTDEEIAKELYERTLQAAMLRQLQDNSADRFTGQLRNDDQSSLETHDDFDLAAKESTEPKGEPDPFE